MSIAADHLGRVLDERYRLDARLGTGSSAHVYLAQDLRLGRLVAIKILHPGLANDPTFRRRFRSEARAAAALNHPNIVQVYDWADDADGTYLVLELLGGGSLRDLLAERGPISLAQAASCGAAAARALEYAHQRGLIHRDIKPANLLFDDAGSVHLADFGLAKALVDSSSTEPQGIVLGTARYVSPEQALGQPLDGRSDVYSLAVVLYEAVVGSVPFEGESPFATLMARVGKPLPAATVLGALDGCLRAATRADRVDSGQFASMLEAVLDQLGEPAPLRPPGHHVRAADPDSTIRLGLDAPFRDDGTVSYVGDPAALGTRTSDSKDLTSTVGVITEDVVGHRPRRDRRRHRGRLAVVIVAAMVLIALGLFAVPHYAIFNHAVPRVVHEKLASAEQHVQAHGLRLRVESREFSDAVPVDSVIRQNPAAGQRERSGTLVTVVVSRGPAMIPVPKVAGEAKAIALDTIVKAHFAASTSTAYSETVPAGDVIATTPATGTAHYGTKVAVTISLGPSPRTIPQFPASTTFADAAAQLKELRLVPVEQLQYSTEVDKGDVISTDPSEGAAGIPVGSQVNLVVSKGPQLVAVPIVANEPIGAAIASLQQSGLTVNEQIGPPFATHATTTNPAPGSEVQVGSLVTLYVA